MNNEDQPEVGSAAFQKSVLVVDHDPAARHFVGLVLRKAGYHVFEVESPDKAQRIANGGHQIDLLLTDYQMPVMNGALLAGWFREMFPHIPVLVLTGVPELAAVNGMYHPTFVCLAKPVLPRELTEVVASMISRGPTWSRC